MEIRSKKRYATSLGEIEVEIVCTPKEFKWKMRSVNHPEFDSGWTDFYEGILILEFGGLKIGFATDYWRGALPVETPFQITELLEAKDGKI